MGSVTESSAIGKCLSHLWVAGLGEFLVVYGSARENKNVCIPASRKSQSSYLKLVRGGRTRSKGKHIWYFGHAACADVYE
jgi:hypothetical protein